MNYVDIILLLVLALAIWGGWKKGFIQGTINLVIWIGSLLAGFLFYKYLGDWLQNYVPGLGVWTLPLAFITTIIFSRLILALIFNTILRNTPEDVHRNVANRFLGIIPGFINGIIYTTIVAAILLSIPLRNELSAKTKESKISNKLAVGISWLDDQFSPIFDEAVKKSLTRITVEPESNESVKLNFTVTDAHVRPDLEERMLLLINEERTKRGLKPLSADPELVPVSRAHSKDMFARGYFSHYSPEGIDPFGRMKMANIKYRAAGENLALGQTLNSCHIGLMNLPGHRANILNPAFGRVGIGILDGGTYGLMISQEFRD